MYVDSSGAVTNRKPITRYIKDYFWGIIAFFTLLFSTFFNPSKPIPKRSQDPDYTSRPLGGSRGSNVRDMGTIRSRLSTCAAGS